MCDCQNLHNNFVNYAAKEELKGAGEGVDRARNAVRGSIQDALNVLSNAADNSVDTVNEAIKTVVVFIEDSLKTVKDVFDNISGKKSSSKRSNSELIGGFISNFNKQLLLKGGNELPESLIDQLSSAFIGGFEEQGYELAGSNDYEKFMSLVGGKIELIKSLSDDDAIAMRELRILMGFVSKAITDYSKKTSKGTLTASECKNMQKSVGKIAELFGDLTGQISALMEPGGKQMLVDIYEKIEKNGPAEAIKQAEARGEITRKMKSDFLTIFKELDTISYVSEKLTKLLKKMGTGLDEFKKLNPMKMKEVLESYVDKTSDINEKTKRLKQAKKVMKMMDLGEELVGGEETVSIEPVMEGADDFGIVNNYTFEGAGSNFGLKDEALGMLNDVGSRKNLKERRLIQKLLVDQDKHIDKLYETAVTALRTATFDEVGSSRDMVEFIAKIKYLNTFDLKTIMEKILTSSYTSSFDDKQKSAVKRNYDSPSLYGVDYFEENAINYIDDIISSANKIKQFMPNIGSFINALADYKKFIKEVFDKLKKEKDTYGEQIKHDSSMLFGGNLTEYLGGLQAYRLNDVVQLFTKGVTLSKMKIGINLANKDMEYFEKFQHNMNKDIIGKSIDILIGQFNDMAKNYKEKENFPINKTLFVEVLRDNQNGIISLKRAAQGLDELIRVYTVEVSKDSEKVRDMVKLLQEVQVDFDWIASDIPEIKEFTRLFQIESVRKNAFEDSISDKITYKNMFDNVNFVGARYTDIENETKLANLRRVDQNIARQVRDIMKKNKYFLFNDNDMTLRPTPFPTSVNNACALHLPVLAIAQSSENYFNAYDLIKEKSAEFSLNMSLFKGHRFAPYIHADRFRNVPLNNANVPAGLIGSGVTSNEIVSEQHSRSTSAMDISFISHADALELYRTARGKLYDAVEKIGALQNLLGIFQAIDHGYNNKAGKGEEKSMQVKEIYENILEYLVLTTMYPVIHKTDGGEYTASHIAKRDFGKDICYPGATKNTSGTLNSYYVQLEQGASSVQSDRVKSNSFGTVTHDNNDTSFWAYKDGPDLTRTDVSFSTNTLEKEYYEEKTYDDNSWERLFYNHDRLLTMMIKSVFTKIVGTFAMYDVITFKPTEELILKHHQVRSIYGGVGDYTYDRYTLKPEIKPELTETYIRLWVYGMYYRGLFASNLQEGSNGKLSTQALAIKRMGLLPVIGGNKFDNLIKFFMVRQFNKSDIDYSIFREFVNVVNGLAQSTKKSGNKLLEEFVQEVNRRYGILTSNNLKTYLDREKIESDFLLSDNLNFEDPFAVPGTTTDKSYGFKQADFLYKGSPGKVPSDEFNVRKSTFYNLFEGDSKNPRFSELISIVYQFRKKLDGLMGNLDTKFRESLDHANIAAGTMADRSSSKYGIRMKLLEDELTRITNQNTRFEKFKRFIEDMGTSLTSSNNYVPQEVETYRELVLAPLNLLVKIYIRLLGNIGLYGDTTYNVALVKNLNLYNLASCLSDLVELKKVDNTDKVELDFTKLSADCTELLRYIARTHNILKGAFKQTCITRLNEKVKLLIEVHRDIWSRTSDLLNINYDSLCINPIIEMSEFPHICPSDKILVEEGMNAYTASISEGLLWESDQLKMTHPAVIKGHKQRDDVPLMTFKLFNKWFKPDNIYKMFDFMLIMVYKLFWEKYGIGYSKVFGPFAKLTASIVKDFSIDRSDEELGREHKFEKDMPFSNKILCIYKFLVNQEEKKKYLTSDFSELPQEYLDDLRTYIPLFMFMCKHISQIAAIHVEKLNSNRICRITNSPYTLTEIAGDNPHNTITNRVFIYAMFLDDIGMLTKLFKTNRLSRDEIRQVVENYNRQIDELDRRTVDAYVDKSFILAILNDPDLGNFDNPISTDVVNRAAENDFVLTAAYNGAKTTFALLSPYLSIVRSEIQGLFYDIELLRRNEDDESANIRAILNNIDNAINRKINRGLTTSITGFNMSREIYGAKEEANLRPRTPWKTSLVKSKLNDEVVLTTTEPLIIYDPNYTRENIMYAAGFAYSNSEFDKAINSDLSVLKSFKSGNLPTNSNGLSDYLLSNYDTGNKQYVIDLLSDLKDDDKTKNISKKWVTSDEYCNIVAAGMILKNKNLLKNTSFMDCIEQCSELKGEYAQRKFLYEKLSKMNNVEVPKIVKSEYDFVSALEQRLDLSGKLNGHICLQQNLTKNMLYYGYDKFVHSNISLGPIFLDYDRLKEIKKSNNGCLETVYLFLYLEENDFRNMIKNKTKPKNLKNSKIYDAALKSGFNFGKNNSKVLSKEECEMVEAVLLIANKYKGSPIADIGDLDMVKAISLVMNIENGKLLNNIRKLRVIKLINFKETYSYWNKMEYSDIAKKLFNNLFRSDIHISFYLNYLVLVTRGKMVFTVASNPDYNPVDPDSSLLDLISSSMMLRKIAPNGKLTVGKYKEYLKIINGSENEIFNYLKGVNSFDPDKDLKSKTDAKLVGGLEDASNIAKYLENFDRIGSRVKMVDSNVNSVTGIKVEKKITDNAEITGLLNSSVGTDIINCIKNSKYVDKETGRTHTDVKKVYLTLENKYPEFANLAKIDNIKDIMDILRRISKIGTSSTVVGPTAGPTGDGIATGIATGVATGVGPTTSTGLYSYLRNKVSSGYNITKNEIAFGTEVVGEYIKIFIRWLYETIIAIKNGTMVGIEELINTIRNNKKKSAAVGAVLILAMSAWVGYVDISPITSWLESVLFTEESIVEYTSNVVSMGWEPQYMSVASYGSTALVPISALNNTVNAATAAEYVGYFVPTEIVEEVATTVGTRLTLNYWGEALSGVLSVVGIVGIVKILTYLKDLLANRGRPVTPPVVTPPAVLAGPIGGVLPAGGPVAAQPVVGVAAQPVVGVAAQPVVGVAAQPVVGVAAQPVVGVAAQPVVGVAAQPVVGVAANNQPAGVAANNQPAGVAANNQPVVGVAANNQPVVVAANNQPPPPPPAAPVVPPKIHNNINYTKLSNAMAMNGANRAAIIMNDRQIERTIDNLLNNDYLAQIVLNNQDGITAMSIAIRNILDFGPYLDGRDTTGRWAVWHRQIGKALLKQGMVGGNNQDFVQSIMNKLSVVKKEHMTETIRASNLSAALNNALGNGNLPVLRDATLPRQPRQPAANVQPAGNVQLAANVQQQQPPAGNVQLAANVQQQQQPGNVQLAANVQQQQPAAANVQIRRIGAQNPFMNQINRVPPLGAANPQAGRVQPFGAQNGPLAAVNNYQAPFAPQAPQAPQARQARTKKINRAQRLPQQQQQPQPQPQAALVGGGENITEDLKEFIAFILSMLDMTEELNFTTIDRIFDQVVESDNYKKNLEMLDSLNYFTDSFSVLLSKIVMMMVPSLSDIYAKVSDTLTKVSKNIKNSLGLSKPNLMVNITKLNVEKGETNTYQISDELSFNLRMGISGIMKKDPNVMIEKINDDLSALYEEGTNAGNLDIDIKDPIPIIDGRIYKLMATGNEIGYAMFNFIESEQNLSGLEEKTVDIYYAKHSTGGHNTVEIYKIEANGDSIDKLQISNSLDQYIEISAGYRGRIENRLFNTIANNAITKINESTYKSSINLHECEIIAFVDEKKNVRSEGKLRLSGISNRGADILSRKDLILKHFKNTDVGEPNITKEDGSRAKISITIDEKKCYDLDNSIIQLGENSYAVLEFSCGLKNFEGRGESIEFNNAAMSAWKMIGGIEGTSEFEVFAAIIKTISDLDVEIMSIDEKELYIKQVVNYLNRYMLESYHGFSLGDANNLFLATNNCIAKANNAIKYSTELYHMLREIYIEVAETPTYGLISKSKKDIADIFYKNVKSKIPISFAVDLVPDFVTVEPEGILANNTNNRNSGLGLNVTNLEDLIKMFDGEKSELFKISSIFIIENGLHQIDLRSIPSFVDLLDKGFPYKDSLERMSRVFGNLMKYLYELQMKDNLTSKFSLFNNLANPKGGIITKLRTSTRKNMLQPKIINDRNIRPNDQSYISYSSSLYRNIVNIDQKLYTLSTSGNNMFNSGGAFKSLITTNLFDRQHMLYMIGSELSDCVNLTANFTSLSSNFDTLDEVIAEHVIDTGIYPINIHAMMSELPLSNTLNNNYSADVILRELLLHNESRPEPDGVLDGIPTDREINNYLFTYLKNPLGANFIPITPDASGDKFRWLNSECKIEDTSLVQEYPIVAYHDRTVAATAANASYRINQLNNMDQIKSEKITNLTDVGVEIDQMFGDPYYYINSTNGRPNYEIITKFIIPQKISGDSWSKEYTTSVDTGALINKSKLLSSLSSTIVEKSNASDLLNRTQLVSISDNIYFSEQSRGPIYTDDIRHGVDQDLQQPVLAINLYSEMLANLINEKFQDKFHKQRKGLAKGLVTMYLNEN